MTLAERLSRPCKRGHPLRMRYLRVRPGSRYPGGQVNCYACQAAQSAHYYEHNKPQARRRYRRKKHERLVLERHCFPDVILAVLREIPDAAAQLSTLLHISLKSAQAWIKGGKTKRRFQVKQVIAALEMNLIKRNTQE